MPDNAANTPATLRFAVIGNPVSHSLSPVIHRQFAAQFKRPMQYHKISCSRASFAGVVSDFFVSGGQGLNVTAPFKMLAAQVSANHGQSINTLKASGAGATVTGISTDGTGLVSDLLAKYGNLGGVEVLLLGAGGAAQAVVAELLEHGANIAVLNRSAEPAARLVSKHQGQSIAPHRPEKSYQLVINAASAGGAVLLESAAVDLSNTDFCYDLCYGPQSDPLRALASKHRCEFADGIGMLVEQAAASYFYWTGNRPNTSAITLD